MTFHGLVSLRIVGGKIARFDGFLGHSHDALEGFLTCPAL
jgi:hypothetical protein